MKYHDSADYSHMRSPTNVWVVSTCLHLMLLCTENKIPFGTEAAQIYQKALLPCSSLCSPSIGLSWEPEASHSFLRQDIWKVPVNAFCEGMWAIFHVTALSCCYYICLIFLTHFRSQSFRYLMQNKKGERGQNLSPVICLHHKRYSFLISMVIMQFVFHWSYTSLSVTKEEMLKGRPM